MYLNNKFNLCLHLQIIDRSYEMKYLHGAKVVETLDPCIFVLFLLEMILKWMAYGLQKFFRSHLGRFEFFILLVNDIYLYNNIKYNHIKIFSRY